MNKLKYVLSVVILLAFPAILVGPAASEIESDGLTIDDFTKEERVVASQVIALIEVSRDRLRESEPERFQTQEEQVLLEKDNAETRTISPELALLQDARSVARHVGATTLAALEQKRLEFAIEIAVAGRVEKLADAPGFLGVVYDWVGTDSPRAKVKFTEAPVREATDEGSWALLQELDAIDGVQIDGGRVQPVIATA